MRIANIILGVILVFFAALQWNDPDVAYWAMVYLVASAWPLIAAFRPWLMRPGTALRNAVFVSLGAFAMDFWWLMDTIGPGWIHVEEARESFGYLICVATTALALFATRTAPAGPSPATLADPALIRS